MRFPGLEVGVGAAGSDGGASPPFVMGLVGFLLWPLTVGIVLTSRIHRHKVPRPEAPGAPRNQPLTSPANAKPGSVANEERLARVPSLVDCLAAVVPWPKGPSSRRTYAGQVGEVPTVRSDRLLLPAWQESDRAPLAALNADPELMGHFPEPYSRAASDSFIDRIESRVGQHGYGLWAVERVDTGSFIGYVGLSPATFRAPFSPAVEVGWRLAAPHWGQGFATEGAGAALDFGFATPVLAEIVSLTARRNVRPWRVMERLGMIRDPAMDFEHPDVPEHHPARPHLVYRMTRERWTELRQGPAANS